MKNLFKVFGIIAIVAVIGFSFVACGGDDGGSTNIDTTALSAVINEASHATDRVEKASAASEVPTGKKWVTESEWNAFDTVYKTAVETKTNPSSQSAVDTAKTNLQAAIVTFNAAKKEGSAPSITLSGTITVKIKGQIVPFVVLRVRNNDWSWNEYLNISLSSSSATPWSIITTPFSSPTEVSFEISGYDNDENALFNEITIDLKKTISNTDVNNIDINVDLTLITISGTLSLDYGKVIPSVQIEIRKKDDSMVKLGDVRLLNVGRSTTWSIIIPSQTVDTDVVFSIVGFDGPIPWAYDQLFGFWGKDFGVKVKNTNVSGIALNLGNIQ